MMHWDWQGWNIKLYFSGWFCFEWSLSSSSPSCPIFDYASGCPAPFGSICAVPFRFRLPTSWSVRSAPSLPWIPCFSLSWSSARCGAPSAGPRSPAAAAPPGQPKSDCGKPTFRARLWSRWSLKCRSSPATSPCLSGSPPNGTRISCRLSWWPWRSFGGEIVWWPPRADGSRWSSLILDWWAQLARLAAYQLDLYLEAGTSGIEQKLSAIGEDGLPVGEKLVAGVGEVSVLLPDEDSQLDWLAHAKSHLLDSQQNTVHWYNYKRQKCQNIYGIMR